MLRKAAAALAPGGVLFVLGWDRQNSVLGIGGPRPSEVLYALDDLAEALDGLHIVHAEQIRQAGSPDTLDTLITARRPPSQPHAPRHGDISGLQGAG